jgi:hypothetical protein
MESLFLEAAHVWPAVGHTRLRQFLGLGCGPCGASAETIRAAGVGVDRSTVDGTSAGRRPRGRRSSARATAVRE